MTPLAVAAVWAGAGTAGAALLPSVRLRRLGALVPLAGLAALLAAAAAAEVAVPGGSPAASLSLDRTALGLLAACAVSLALLLLIAPTVDGPELRALGLVGAAAVVALAAGSSIVWAMALLGGTCILALRWIAMAPGRATFASGRVAIGGAGALVAAAPFLPVGGALTGPRPVLVAALLACGLASLLGLLPLGGWTLGALSSVASADVAAWPLLMAPAVLLSAQRVLTILPVLGLVYYEGILTVLGLSTALWHALLSVRQGTRARYGRVVLADLGLAAAAIGTGHIAQSQPALLLLVLTHLLAGPVLLQREGAGGGRFAWLLLCGLPPSPSFWGRLLVVEALTQASFWGTVAALATMSLQFMTSVRVLVEGRRRAETGDELKPGLRWAIVEAARWAAILGGVTVGLAPHGALMFVFGVH